MPEKKTKGRQKIAMKFIDDDNARRITFTKRRSGLFKKATELSALCGADVAIILLSSAGKAYSFGNPSVDSVIGRFVKDDRNGVVALSEDDSDNEKNLKWLMEKLERMNEELEMKKARAKELEEALGKVPPGRLGISEEYLKGLDLVQLRRVKESLEKLRDDIRRAVEGSAAAGGSLDLAKVEGSGYGEDGAPAPIPCNWLKL